MIKIQIHLTYRHRVWKNTQQKNRDIKFLVTTKVFETIQHSSDLKRQAVLVSLHDAIMNVKDVVEYPYVVVGGGASEVAVSQKIREWSGALSGREQLAAEKFADALNQFHQYQQKMQIQI